MGKYDNVLKKKNRKQERKTRRLMTQVQFLVYNELKEMEEEGFTSCSPAEMKERLSKKHVEIPVAVIAELMSNSQLFEEIKEDTEQDVGK